MKKYFFRITPGKTPFHVGSAAKDMGFSGKIKDDIYVSPALYPWIHKYFNNEDNNVFVIQRPSNINPLTMCCGINSVYHYVYLNKDKKIVSYVEDRIIHHDFKDKVILELTKELNERVKKRFGKTLKEMKGGTYLGTLMDWDKILHNVCLISFLQGLPLGTSVYNNYVIVPSTENKQFVDETNIYYIGYGGTGTNAADGCYHRLGCEHLKGNTIVRI